MRLETHGWNWKWPERGDHNAGVSSLYFYQELPGGLAQLSVGIALLCVLTLVVTWCVSDSNRWCGGGDCYEVPGVTSSFYGAQNLNKVKIVENKLLPRG